MGVDLDVVRDGGGEDQAAQGLQALPDLLAQGRGGQVGQVDFLRLEAALLEVAPQGGHQAVVLIQEVTLALRQAEVGEGTLRVALAGGGPALAVVLHKQVVLLQHRLDLPGLFIGDEPLPHRFPGGQVVDAGAVGGDGVAHSRQGDDFPREEVLHPARGGYQQNALGGGVLQGQAVFLGQVLVLGDGGAVQIKGE